MLNNVSYVQKLNNMQVYSKKIIFGTGTPRSGGTLMSNFISINKEICITTDLVHFFRHIYKKYGKLTYSKKVNIALEFYLRLKFRQNILINLEEFIEKIKIAKNYKDILIIISNYISTEIKKKRVGEYANSEWHNINNFLNLDQKFKAFQIIRDPRAMLISWKKITYEKNYNYLNIIFHWVDAINYYEKNKKKFSSKRFKGFKFEEIHLFPEKTAKSICKFLEITFDKKMLKTQMWPKFLNNKFTYINSSSYNNKKMFGFSISRINNWKNNILDWELALTQFLLHKHLKRYKYEIFDYDKNLVKKGLKIMKRNPILKKNLKRFLDYGKGTHKKLSDPTNPKNWAATDLSKNPRLKFIETKDFSFYKLEKKKLLKKYKTKALF